MARLFLAIWPDPAVRASLARLRDEWTWPDAARPVPDERLHLTLHFIGSFPGEGVDLLGEHLASVPPRPMTLRATGFELWRGGIAVLCLEPEPALAALHEALGSALSALGVPLESRPFAPHVTLARRALHARRPQTPPDLAWHAEGHALVESITGSNASYRLVRTYPGPA
jgi:2'-5' RNA ligase